MVAHLQGRHGGLPLRFLIRFSVLILAAMTACSGSRSDEPIPVSARPPHQQQQTAATASVPNATTSGPSVLPSNLVVSVLYFEDRTRTPELRWLRKGLADMLITDLSRAPWLQVVLRERLEAIVREQALQAGGRIEDRTAVRIGHLAGATVILAGSLTRVGDVLRLDAQLLDVERGTVIGATAVEGGAGEVLELEKQLAANILAMLKPDSRHDPGERTLPPHARTATRSPEAAAALYEGMDAADRGDVGSALAKFEAALGKDPRYVDAQGPYERALRSVNAEVLWARVRSGKATPDDRRRLAARLAGDLFRQGIQAKITGVTPIGSPLTQPSPPVGARGNNVPSPFRGEGKGEGGGFTGVRIGVSARVDEHALQNLRQGVVRLGGMVEEREGLLLIRVSEDPDVQAAFVQVIGPARRLYLHILTADGRRLAAFSRFRGWRGADWVSVGQDGVVEFRLGHAVADDILLTGLSDGSPARVLASFDLVPREHGLIQLDLLGTTSIGRETLLSPRAQGRRDQVDGTEVMAKWADDFRAVLQNRVEEVWDPPVWERVTGPGYLPGARRSAMVSVAIQAGGPVGKHFVVAGRPTLSGKSGDGTFDAACMRALSALEAPVGRGDQPMAFPEGGIFPTLRARITCVLLKDIPAIQTGP